MTRDSNAYLGVVAVPAIAAALLRASRKRFLLVALLGASAVCAAGVADAAYAHRGDEPARDAIYIRLSKEDPSALAWMKAHGYTSIYAVNTVSVYESFLLHHPLWTLFDPLRDRASYATFSSGNRLTALYTPNVRGYDSGGARLHVPGAVEDLFWPTRPLLLGIELSAILALLSVGFLRGSVGGGRALVVLSAAAILAVYPQVLVVWHFSGQEVDRHSLVPAAQLRIAMILLVAIGIDALSEASRRGRIQAGGDKATST